MAEWPRHDGAAAQKVAHVLARRVSGSIYMNHSYIFIALASLSYLATY